MRAIQTNIYRRHYRNGRESWMVRWKDHTTGAWIARTAGRTKNEALIAEAKVRDELLKGIDPTPSKLEISPRMTVAQVAERFYQSSKFLTARPEWQAERRRLITVDVVPRLGSLHFEKLTKDTVVKYYLAMKERKLSNATIQKYHALLCALGDVYAENTPNAETPIRKIRDYKKLFPDEPSTREINFLMPEELASLFAAAGKSQARLLLPFIQFLAHTGLRRSEALQLKKADVDCASGFVHIRKSKSGKARMVPLEREAEDALTYMWVNCSDYVFAELDGTRHNDRYFLKPLKRAAEAAGITKRVDLHTLRHSYGSNKIRQGWGLKKVSMILGHSDISITSRVYTHLLDGDLKVRDDFAFDINQKSANHQKDDMAQFLTMMISKLTETSEETLTECLDRALSALQSPELRQPLKMAPAATAQLPADGKLRSFADILPYGLKEKTSEFSHLNTEVKWRP